MQPPVFQTICALALNILSLNAHEIARRHLKNLTKMWCLVHGGLTNKHPKIEKFFGKNKSMEKTDRVRDQALHMARPTRVCTHGIPHPFVPSGDGVETKAL